MPLIDSKYIELLKRLVTTSSEYYYDKDGSYYDIVNGYHDGLGSFHEEIEKRGYYDSYGNYHSSRSSNRGYWGFFALIAVVAVLLVCCVNSGRERRGQPILYGTTYLDPQRYYNPTTTQPTQSPPPPPQYTPQAGANDRGYYDQDGNFVVANEDNTYPYKTEYNNNGQSAAGLEHPEEVYQRPEGPPPSQQQPFTGNQGFYKTQAGATNSER